MPSPLRKQKFCSYEMKFSDSKLLYSIEQNPPWYLAVLLGIQHYLTMLGATVSIPSLLFCSGIVTLLQTSVGVRLPIVQGGTFSFITPAISILALRGECSGYKNVWQDRIVEVQGAIIVSSLFQIFLGACGGVGFLLRFIGPLTVVPSITLIGLSLFEAAAFYGSSNWGITFFGIICITVFSQVISEFGIFNVRVFKLFPVVLGMICSWVLCLILTESGVITDNSSKNGYRARTDLRSDVLQDSDWFYFPYPCQWGEPKVTVAGVFGMLAGVLAGIVESVGDYFPCARFSGAPTPTVPAINRGILIEGLGCLFAGLIGTGNGTTSYSENIGALGITRVGSRRVVQFGALVMILLGCFAKVGALFATIPAPVIGANFFCMFGIITAVGLSNLQFVNLNSTRNLYILGFSLFCGFAIPNWIKQNPGAIDTGVDELDQVIEVLLGTSMFIGGFLGCLLDNVIPGNSEDRGLKKWRNMQSVHTDNNTYKAEGKSVYDLPFITPFLRNHKIFRFIPISPTFAFHLGDPEENEQEKVEKTTYKASDDQMDFETAIKRTGSQRSTPYQITSL